MSHDLIPPPGLDHPLPADVTPEQCFRLWMEMVEASDQLLMAGFRATLGSEAAAREAFRNWYKNYYDEHYEVLVRMAERFNQAQRNHERASGISNT
jgi:hypothetical protein